MRWVRITKQSESIAEEYVPGSSWGFVPVPRGTVYEGWLCAPIKPGFAVRIQTFEGTEVRTARVMILGDRWFVVRGACWSVEFLD